MRKYVKHLVLTAGILAAGVAYGTSTTRADGINGSCTTDCPNPPARHSTGSNCHGFWVNLGDYTFDSRITVWLDGTVLTSGEFVDHANFDDFNNSYDRDTLGGFTTWRVKVTSGAVNGAFDTGTQTLPSCTPPTTAPPTTVALPPVTAAATATAPAAPVTAAPAPEAAPATATVETGTAVSAPKVKAATAEAKPAPTALTLAPIEADPTVWALIALI